METQIECMIQFKSRCIQSTTGVKSKPIFNTFILKPHFTRDLNTPQGHKISKSDEIPPSNIRSTTNHKTLAKKKKVPENPPIKHTVSKRRNSNIHPNKTNESVVNKVNDVSLHPSTTVKTRSGIRQEKVNIDAQIKHDIPVPSFPKHIHDSKSTRHNKVSKQQQQQQQRATLNTLNLEKMDSQSTHTTQRNDNARKIETNQEKEDDSDIANNSENQSFDTIHTLSETSDVDDDGDDDEGEKEINSVIQFLNTQHTTREFESDIESSVVLDTRQSSDRILDHIMKPYVGDTYDVGSISIDYPHTNVSDSRVHTPNMRRGVQKLPTQQINPHQNHTHNRIKSTIETAKEKGIFATLPTTPSHPNKHHDNNDGDTTICSSLSLVDPRRNPVSKCDDITNDDDDDGSVETNIINNIECNETSRERNEIENESHPTCQSNTEDNDTDDENSIDTSDTDEQKSDDDTIANKQYQRIESYIKILAVKTVKDLREICKQYKLAVRGSKSDILERISTHLFKYPDVELIKV